MDFKGIFSRFSSLEIFDLLSCVDACVSKISNQNDLPLRLQSIGSSALNSNFILSETFMYTKTPVYVKKYPSSELLAPTIILRQHMFLYSENRQPPIRNRAMLPNTNSIALMRDTIIHNSVQYFVVRFVIVFPHSPDMKHWPVSSVG